MIEQLEMFWPILVSMFGLWAGGIGIAVGCTAWVVGQLMKQDAKRIELKEAVLFEIRTKHESLRNHIDNQHASIWAKINELTNRLTRVETKLEQTADDRNGRNRD